MDEQQAERPYTAEEITWATRRLNRAMSKLLVAFAHDVGISVTELLALDNLDEDGLGPSDLARRLQLTSGAITDLVDRLERRGHALREPHPSDRRRVVLRRTAKADGALSAEVAPMARQVLELAAGLSDEERQTVGRFLDQLSTIVDRTADSKSASPPDRTH
jgi:DNA-binding MarR family transcriptional regulator